MTLTITDTLITSDATAHLACAHVPGRPDEGWQVSWLPGRVVDQIAAVAAMTLAEQVDRNGLWDYRNSANIDAWAAELGLTGPQAIEMIGTTLEAGQ
jgi:hypothetical protein